uniref:U-scoloptoxin(15)-Sm2a n=2 Tax=Scolopendra morsitans TaxID=943129 RepID=TXF2A_SCOMO|nr:RecName: Full=U-scoloptoxin(15)-Sm2a; Short=U-SLPTX(15)-Sm2a; Flags: Precursor [Scolopendra morsitans]
MKFYIVFCLFVVLLINFAAAEETEEPIRHAKKNPSEGECKKACADAFANGDQSKIAKAENFKDYYCNCHIIIH